MWGNENPYWLVSEIRPDDALTQWAIILVFVVVFVILPACFSNKKDR